VRLLYLVHQYFPRHVGGTEVYTRSLVRRARAAGHDVEVITYHEAESDFGVHRTQHEGVPLAEVHYNLSTAPDPARFEYDNPFIAGLVRGEIARFRPDLVHVMHAMKLSVAALDACVDAGVPTVVTLCDFWFVCPRHTLLTWDDRPCRGPRHATQCVRCVNRLHGFAGGPAVRWWPEALLHPWLRAFGGRDVRAIAARLPRTLGSLARARRVIALSRFQRDLFVENGFPADRLEVIDHGLEVDGLDAPRGAQPARPRFVFIGSFARHKGLHVLLAALAREPALDVECRVYGDGGGAYARDVRTLAAADPRVRLLGRFPPQEQGRILAEAEVVVVPALWYENNPLVVKAALRAGVPVLASRIGCLPEWITPSTGWLAEPGDVASWSAALARARAEFAPLGRVSAAVKTMDENGREMLDVYARVAHG